MQYGADIFPYKRLKESIKNRRNREEFESLGSSKIFMYFITSLLISRVLFLNVENLMAPFGIAFLIVISLHKRECFIISACGSLIGYLSIYNSINNFPSYLCIIGTITISAYMLEEKSKKIRLALLFITIFGELLICELWIRNLTLQIAFFTAFLQMVCIIPLYFILERSILCINKLRTKHLFSSEEIISVTVVIALMIAGTWGISIAKVSFTNILALTFILALSYINGSTVGASAGIAIGAIIGVCSGNLLIYMAVYGVCGFLAGIFEKSGKIICGFAYVIMFFVLMLYCNISAQFKPIEIIVSIAIFLIIPNRVYKKINLELDWEKKQEYLNKDIVNNVKDLMVNKLESFSDVLYDMSKTLSDLAYNDKLLMKRKSSGLIENLADRVCSTCSMNTTCWKKEIYYTYAAFGELIENYEEQRKDILPQEIQKKCVKRTLLLKNTEDIVNKYILKEMWRKRQSEGRKILSNQINSVGDSLKELVKEFNVNIKFNTDIEKKVRKILENQGIKYKDVFCFENKNDRLIIKMSLNACGGSQLCVKKILPFINEVTDKFMCVNEEGCVIDPKTEMCKVTFIETPKYYISSYIAKCCKSGEKCSGDSYSFGKTTDENYMCIISDGMGSGPEAKRESKIAVDMIEKFVCSGLDKIKAINTVNTVMSLKFPQEEKFSTLDLCDIDLYYGNVNFTKIGAVSSFIKSGKNVEVIKSKTLPIGVLDDVDIEVIDKKVKNGDFIVMLSDGVSDYDINNAGKVDWVVHYLKENNINNPEELAKGILEKAKKLSGDKAKDDMTVIVSKAYELY